MFGSTPYEMVNSSTEHPHHSANVDRPNSVSQSAPALTPQSAAPVHSQLNVTSSTGDSASFYRLIERVISDLNEAHRLFSIRNVQTFLVSNAQKCAYIAGQISSTERALAATGSFLADGTFSHGLRTDTQQELATCHASLLQAIATMQPWANELEMVSLPSYDTTITQGKDDIDDLLELLRSPYRRRRERELRKVERAAAMQQAGPLPSKTTLSFPGLSGIVGLSPGQSTTVSAAMPPRNTSDAAVPKNEQDPKEESNSNPPVPERYVANQRHPPQPGPSPRSQIPPSIAMPSPPASMTQSTHTSPQQPRSELSAASPAIRNPSITSHSARTSPQQSTTELNSRAVPSRSRSPHANASELSSSPLLSVAQSARQRPVSATALIGPQVSPPWNMQSAATSMSTLAIDSKSVLSLPSTGIYPDRYRSGSFGAVGTDSTPAPAQSSTSVLSLPSTNKYPDHYRSGSFGAVEMDATPAPTQSSTTLGSTNSPAQVHPTTRSESLPADTRYPILIENSGMWIGPMSSSQTSPPIPDRDNFPEVYNAPPTTFGYPTLPHGSLGALPQHQHPNNALYAPFGTFLNLSTTSLNSNASPASPYSNLTDAYRNPSVGYPATTGNWQQPSSLTHDRDARKARRAALEKG